ncbi:unnamed protein product [Ambrosiozyma monospora]|uniref:Unnamed protein product n=1 Tax=Ambrosiozyma monospora TaxID=43982 RepID=A0ACB5T0Y0_AMBMO|nr:unnamed protein product [Ambrosiozyma monospora]
MNIDKFAGFTDALDNASKQAREELKIRAKLKAKLEKQKLLEQQEKLAKVAVKKEKKSSRWANDSDDDEEQEDEAKLNAASKREKARREMRKKAEKELKMANMSTESKLQMMASESGKSISNRVKVGLSKQSEQNNKSKMELNYDSRLFLNAAGANAKNSEDQVYDSPLFESQTAVNDLYRVRNDSRFTGRDDDEADETVESVVGKTSGGPILFEKDTGDDHDEERPSKRVRNN